jgi:hypothetical protein
VDAMQMETSNSNAWSVSTVASCGDGEGRPETEGGSGVVGVLDLLREKAKGGHQWVRQDGGGSL